MNPILWKSTIISSVAIICATFASEPLNYIILGIGSVPVLVGSWGFLHFARNDPQRLQSESHIEQMEMLSRIGQRGEDSKKVIDGGNLTSNKSVEKEK
ncbi:hypothetical protein LCM18_07530 [Qipengyuania flava]|nr:hypothetical protein LCM18_07530 [Qipengyuania flava]